MQETYFDCPFYEQLQYAMDARSEILYTYAVSADDRLARRTMEDFRLSQRSDGLLNSCAPSVRTNVIPGFSIYYILMLHDHMMYFGDRELIRRHLPAVDGVLGFFDANRAENGLVAKVGGPHFEAPYWSFIDWTPQWDKTGGVPTACLQKTGSITMESLLYLLGLDAAKELCRYAGRPDTAREYEGRAGALREALLSSCMGEYALPDGSHIRLLQDGPGVEEYSVHCQAFAILCGLVSAREGRKMLRTVLDDPERFAQCSVAMQFYLFRALEKAEWYEKTDDLWNLWRRMVSDHMTTCVENDTDARSDCHAWASLILYELPGVCLADPEEKWVYCSPLSWHPDSCRGMWNEVERGTEHHRLRRVRLLDRTPGAPVKAQATPDILPFGTTYEAFRAAAARQKETPERHYRVAGKAGGFLELTMTDSRTETVYQHYTDDGLTFWDGRETLSYSILQDTVYCADVSMTGHQTGQMQLRATFTGFAARRLSLSFAPAADGKPASFGYASFGGVTRTMEELRED